MRFSGKDERQIAARVRAACAFGIFAGSVAAWFCVTHGGSWFGCVVMTGIIAAGNVGAWFITE